ncbi:MAG: hypothetical protein R3F60_30470 [bacterium]
MASKDSLRAAWTPLWPAVLDTEASAPPAGLAAFERDALDALDRRLRAAGMRRADFGHPRDGVVSLRARLPADEAAARRTCAELGYVMTAVLLKSRHLAGQPEVVRREAAAIMGATAAELFDDAELPAPTADVAIAILRLLPTAVVTIVPGEAGEELTAEVQRALLYGAHACASLDRVADGLALIDALDGVAAPTVEAWQRSHARALLLEAAGQLDDAIAAEEQALAAVEEAEERAVIVEELARLRGQEPSEAP